MSAPTMNVAPLSKHQIDLFGNPIQEPTREVAVTFDFRERNVRMFIIRGVPWWVGTDVCRSMTITNASVAINGQTRRTKTGKVYTSGGLPADEKHLHSVNTPSGTQQMWLVNEPGVYRLAFTSSKPEAEEFKRRVFHEILPEIRRTGTYLGSKGKRVGRTAKRLGCDPYTAQARCDLADVNLAVNQALAKSGHCPSHFARYHNAVYRGQFGWVAKELRRKLEIGRRKSPADRMSALVLAQQGHIKASAERLISLRPGPVSIEEKEQIIEEVTRGIVSAGLSILGDGWTLGINDLTERGKMLDAVKVQLPAQSA